MNRKTSVAATLTAFLAFSGIAFAEDAVQLPTVPPLPLRANLPVIQERRADLVQTAKEMRDNLKANIIDVRANTKEEMQAASSSTERREIERNAIEQRKEMIENRKENASVISDQRKDLLEARKEKASEIRDRIKEQAHQHIETMKRRYEVALKQFENLVTRIESRIEKMRGNGIDTAQAESALSLAVSAIARARNDAQTLANLNGQIQSGDDARAMRLQVGEDVKTLHESIKSAHNALVNAGKELIAAAKAQRKVVPTDSQSSDALN
jgi:chromosome segregation ATPase